jgi:hypothetical protein
LRSGQRGGGVPRQGPTTPAGIVSVLNFLCGGGCRATSFKREQSRRLILILKINNFMKTTPKVIEITVKAFADIVKLTPQRIYQLSSDGTLPSVKGSRLPLFETFTAYCMYKDRVPEQLRQVKFATAKVKLEADELELAANKGTLIPWVNANNSIRAYALLIKTMMRTEIEKSGPLLRRNKLELLGASVEIVQSFNTFDIAAEEAVIDRLETECTRLSQDYADALPGESK